MRPGQPGVAPEVVGVNRLDLSTPEPAVTVPDDTPDPLTARGLASVKRQSGARLFPDGAKVLEQHDGWDTWAAELTGTDERITELAADLRHRPWLGRLLRRAPRPKG